ncbi:SDR family oxidoreductase, partial [Burkholderia gladioli]
MKIDLSGKLALVTGSAAGIGLATAKGLAESGASVIVSSRHAGNVSEAEAAVRAAVPGAQVQGFVGDLSNAQGCEALVNAHPKVDILVNNLGVFQQ